jgi:hypothetical protein
MNRDPAVSSPPEHISQKIQGAILKALHEERQPLLWVFAKSFVKAVLLSTLITALLYCVWAESFSSHWIGACVLMSVSLMIGFGLYDYPQPRLPVRGHWTLWVFAKLLIGLTVIMALQLILCPHFALVHIPEGSRFAFLETLTHEYMSLGGMKFCMFMCGFTFSAMGGAFAFSFISKHFSFGRLPQLSLAVGIGLISQTPIALLQILSPSNRPYVLFWLLGSMLGFSLNAILFKSLGEKLLRLRRGLGS